MRLNVHVFGREAEAAEQKHNPGSQKLPSGPPHTAARSIFGIAIYFIEAFLHPELTSDVPPCFKIPPLIEPFIKPRRARSEV